MKERQPKPSRSVISFIAHGIQKAGEQFSAAAADYCSVIFCMHFALKILEYALVPFHQRQ
jgi:nitrate reductase gamma subunit